jgi:branched-chain amino acid transport system permease protein
VIKIVGEIGMSNGQLSTKGGSKLTKPAVYAGLVLVLSVLPLLIKSSYYLHILILTFIYIIATVSLRAIFISGQISLAHAAFMGIGGYTSAILARELGWTPWVCIPLGALMATGVGILIGYIFARLRALHFAMLTLFFGMAVLYVNSTAARWTMGYSGLTGIPALFTTSKVPYYYFFLGLTVLSLIALYRFEFCRLGTTLKAMNQSYLVASSVGINETANRVLAVAVGCFFVGFAGAGYAHYTLVLSHASFSLLQSIYLTMYMIVGGIGTFHGPIIGAAILIIIPELFRGLKEFSPFIFAGILLIVVYAMPQGLIGLPQLFRSLFKENPSGKGITHAS